MAFLGTICLPNPATGAMSPADKPEFSPVPKFTVKTVKGLADGNYPALTAPKNGDDDCRGLYLTVRGNSRSYLMRYSFGGKPMSGTIGPVASVPLAEARKTVNRYRVMVQAGQDPFAKAAPVKAAKAMTFRQDAEDFRTFRLTDGTGWTKGSDAGFQGAFKNHVYPVLGDRDAACLKSSDIVEMLRPLHASHYRTAEKIYAWVNAVIDRAILTDDEDHPRFHRPNPTPRAWAILGERDVPVEPHPAIRWQDAPAVYAMLVAEGLTNPATGLRAMFLEGMPRAAEIYGAKRSEISHDGCNGAVRYTPPDRLKNGRHRRDDAGNMVGLDRPLTQPYLDLMASIPHTVSDFIWPGRKGKMVGGTVYGRARERTGGTWIEFPGHMQGDAMNLLLKKLGVKVTLRNGDVVDAHVHGLRATFSTWVSDNHKAFEQACEVNIDHLIYGKVQGAYKRTDLLAERRALLEKWAAFLGA